MEGGLTKRNGGHSGLMAAQVSGGRRGPVEHVLVSLRMGKKRAKEISKMKENKNDEHRGLGTIHDFLVAAGARGEELRVPGAYVAKGIGAKDTRVLQEMIAAEINPVDPILSSGKGGYYLAAHGPQGRCEIARNRDTVHRRGVHTMARASVYEKAIALRDAAESGQTVMDLDGTGGKHGD